MREYSFLVRAFVFFTLLASTPALAAEPDPAAEARRQYNLGRTAYDAGRYTEAALAWEAAVAIKPHAATLYSAALAWERASHPERAADDFGRALDVPGLTPQEAATSKERMGALERSLGTLLVVGPEGARVQVEGLTEVAVPARLHAAPGAHTLLVRLPDQPVARRDIVVSSGKMTDVDVSQPSETKPPPQLAPPPSAPTPAPAIAPPLPAPSGPPSNPPRQGPPPEPRRTLDVRRAIGFGVTGMGLAVVGAGAVLGLEALGARDAYNAAPTRSSFDHAQSLQTWTNVAFIAGGVLAVGGIVLIVLPSRATSVSVGLTPGGARVGGTF